MNDLGFLPDIGALWHLAVLAVVQGITEFLPISSSAHLILAPRLAGWQDQGLGLDVAMHIGTLAAVVLYFRRDVIDLVVGTGELLRRRRTERARLAGYIILATLPVLVAGVLLQEVIASDFRNVALIATTTAAFGLLLWWADRRAGQATGTTASLDWRMALLIGVVQAVALVPGVSRSGRRCCAKRCEGFTKELVMVSWGVCRSFLQPVTARRTGQHTLRRCASAARVGLVRSRHCLARGEVRQAGTA